MLWGWVPYEGSLTRWVSLQLRSCRSDCTQDLCNASIHDVYSIYPPAIPSLFFYCDHHALLNLNFCTVGGVNILGRSIDVIMCDRGNIGSVGSLHVHRTQALIRTNMFYINVPILILSVDLCRRDPNLYFLFLVHLKGYPTEQHICHHRSHTHQRLPPKWS